MMLIAPSFRFSYPAGPSFLGSYFGNTRNRVCVLIDSPESRQCSFVYIPVAPSLGRTRIPMCVENF